MNPLTLEKFPKIGQNLSQIRPNSSACPQTSSVFYSLEIMTWLGGALAFKLVLNFINSDCAV